MVIRSIRTRINPTVQIIAPAPCHYQDIANKPFSVMAVTYRLMILLLTVGMADCKCLDVCNKELGIADGRIHDDRLSASSAYEEDFVTYGAHRARLDIASWPPGHRANSVKPGEFPWVKVIFEPAMVITGIATQGYGDTYVKEWVTKYMLLYQRDEAFLYFEGLDGNVKTFDGNSDANSTVYQNMPIPAVTSAVTLIPVLWNNNVGLRMELYGCKLEYHFVAWISLADSRFTLDHADTTSEVYLALKNEIIPEVTTMLNGFPGFLAVDLRTLSPQTFDRQPILAAEIKVYCIESREQAVVQKLETLIKTAGSPLFTDYLHTEHPYNCKCSPPTITISLNKTLEHATVAYTNQRFPVTVEFTKNCSSLQGLDLYWEVSKCDEATRECNAVLPYGRPGSTRKSLYPRLFGAGYLYVRCAVKQYNQVLAYDFGYVRITLPPLKVIIKGPRTVFRGNTSVVLLDASESYDPDYKYKKTEGFVISWYCRQEGETFPSEDFYSPTSSRKGKGDAGGCYGNGPGKLNNSLPVLHIDVDDMKVNRTYIFEVVVQREDRITRRTHRLSVKEPFTFSISCASNCGAKVSTTKRLTIKSSCSGPLCHRISRYDWVLYVMNVSSIGDWVEVQNLTDMILTDIDSSNIVIAGADKNSLEENKMYKVRSVALLGSGFNVTAETIFLTNSRPRVVDGRGGCGVLPNEGIVLTTEFSISCFGWLDDDLPLNYDFKYRTTSGLLVIQSGLSANAIARLPVGNITIEVHVSDSLGASIVQRFAVKVKVIPKSDISKVLENSVTGKDSDLKGLVDGAKVDEAAQMAYSILTAVEEADVDKNDKQTVKETIIQQISTVEVKSMQQVTQISAVVVMATEGEGNISLSSQENAVSLLETMTDFVTSQIGSGGQDADVVQEVGGSLLHGISIALSVSTDKARVEEGPNDKKDEKDKTEEEVSLDTEKEQNKKIAEKTLQIIDKLGSGLLATKVPGEKPTVFHADSLSVMLDRQTPAKMAGKTLGQGDEKVSLPSAEALFGADAANLPSVDAQMTMFRDNPYTWDESSTGIKSGVVDFSLKNSAGAAFDVSGLKDPVELFLPITRQDEYSGNKSAPQYFIKPSNGSNNLLFHRITIPSRSDVVSFEIKPENQVVLDVFVSAQTKPTPSSYQFKTRVPDFSSCANYSERTGYYNCSNNPYETTLTSDVTGKTGVHYIGIMFRPNEAAQERSRIARSCRDGSGRQKRSCVGVKDPPTTPPPTPKILIPKYNASTDVNYTMSVTVTSCLYWSEKKQTWTSEGCKIGSKTKSGILHCLCNHLSAFGGDFFVAPNPIDFDKVWAEFGRLGETGNFVVLATVCSIFGVYFLGLVFARRADKKDEMKVVANVYLNDSNCVNGYSYKLHVQTGMWKNQGTTANVGIILYGEEGSSGPIPLSDSRARRKFFARGSVNSFTLTLPHPLGRLFKMQIWHDNSGDSPAWFLQQVEVEDAQAGDKYHFFANKWLALEKGSGEIHFELSAAGKEEERKFTNLFVHRASRSLGDGHLWLSVFTRPPHIAFTRCQRMSCCLSVLFTAMVTNAMFYRAGLDSKDSFQVGPLKLSWTQIKIGIQSSLIAIPINVLVVMIFRNTKQHSHKNVYDINTDGTDTEAPGFLPRFFVYIGWILCILTSLTAAAFTVFYSLMWGTETSNQWLTSTMVSFVQDILVSQPIKVILLASLLSLIIRRPPERERVFGATFQRGEGASKIVTGPPQGDELVRARDYRGKVRDMKKVVVEITLFLLFVVLLMVVCYGNRDSTRFTLTNSMENAFIDFKYHNISSYWKWMRVKLIPALYDTKWYNGQLFDGEEGFIRNREVFMVGMPRLRQLRIKPEKFCEVTKSLPLLGEPFTRCIPSYSSKNEYKTPYNLPNWIPVANVSRFDSVFELERVCPKPWRYRSSSDLQTLSHRGVMATYDGGGFVADLGYNQKTALNVLNKLQINNWIDELSVAIFIEFTVFDPASSLFSVVKYLYERFPTGDLVTKKSVKTLTLYKSSSENFQSFYDVCQLLFMVVILFFLINEIAKIYHQRKKYFRAFWNWVELVQITTAVCSVVMFFLKEKYTSYFVKKVRGNPFETSSADYIVLWSEVEMYVLSFLIFIVTTKFLRLIRFNSHVCQMIGTLTRSVRPLLSFFIVFVSSVLAYTQLGFLLFGSTMCAYSSFFNSLRAVLQMLLGGQMFFYELKSTNSVLGPLFVFLYTVTMAMILLNMFLAILNDSYIDMVEEPGCEYENADLGGFILVHLNHKAKKLNKELALFLRNPFGILKKRKRENRRTATYEKRTTEEVERLFPFEDEAKKEKSLQVMCPIALMESASELSELVYESEGEGSLGSFLNSCDITRSLLALLSNEELHEAKEEEDFNEVIQGVIGIAFAIQCATGGFPTRKPVRETFV